MVDQLGADVAVDYTRPGWTDDVRERLGGKEATLVLDGVGGDLGRGAFDLLGAGGRIVLFGYSSGVDHAVHVRRPGRPWPRARRGRSARR